MMSTTSGYTSFEWKALIIDEQRRILASSRKNPVEILMEVFELFDESFELTKLMEINLFECLKKLAEANRKKPLVDSLEENYFSVYELVHIFQKHKEEIREFSTELYYALLNFMDLLKSKNLYMRIIFS